MRGGTRRRPTDTFNPYPIARTSSRDSDASLASSRPSSIGLGRPETLLLTNKSQQAAAIHAVNSYLSSHNSLLALRAHPISSSKEITETLMFLLHQLDYRVSKLEEDLFVVLKHLKCPFKVSKSGLRAPNTRHNWPSFLEMIHWLVQIALYEEHLEANSRSFVENNGMVAYALDSYLHYLRGEDDQVEALDREFVEKLERERDGQVESVRVLESEFRELGVKVEALKIGHTEKERLEKARVDLERDVEKFREMIREFNQGIDAEKKVLEGLSWKLEAKVEEKRKIDEENEELKKRVDEQSFNVRAADRMKRELLAVEREIGEAEAARGSWEEKTWDLDVAIGHKFKKLEALAMECNQAMRRLKLGNAMQYDLNAKGSTPAEVNGIDYKSALKPGLESFAEGVKKSSMAKLGELISLQEQLSEFSAKIEGKRNCIASLRSQNDEVDAQLSFLRKELEDYIYRCEMEAKRMVEDVQSEAHNLDSLEREAAEILKASAAKLHETIRITEEEIQMEAHELFVVVDAVSKYKEHAESKISEMKSKLSESACAMSDAFKGSLAAHYGASLYTSI